MRTTRNYMIISILKDLNFVANTKAALRRAFGMEQLPPRSLYNKSNQPPYRNDEPIYNHEYNRHLQNNYRSNLEHGPNDNIANRLY